MNAPSRTRPTVGLVAPPDLPPEEILRVARHAESVGLDELWVWEDCFATSGLAPAAAVLAATSRIRVGLGLMPTPLRAPSLTAMEIATLGRMFPGRFRPGMGHGVQSWMGQAGVRVASPLTLLREQVTALRALLAGEQVSVEGRYVRLDAVQLRWPPEIVPELLVGGRGPKTLTLAGELADGVIFDDIAGSGIMDAERTAQAVSTVREAYATSGRSRGPAMVALLPTPDGIGAAELDERIEALGDAGITTVTVVAGYVDEGPIAGDDRILALADTLGEVLRG